MLMRARGGPLVIPAIRIDLRPFAVLHARRAVLASSFGWRILWQFTRQVTWFLRKAAASSLEHHLVCRLVRSGVAFWFATPRTPPLWQRHFFLVNCLVLRSLLASERSGVVKTFRWTSQINRIVRPQTTLVLAARLSHDLPPRPLGSDVRREFDARGCWWRYRRR